jgi:hypothetical protein
MKYWLTSVFLLLRLPAVNGNMALQNGRFASRNEGLGREFGEFVGSRA